ncbi:MAG: serine protease [Corynebacterium sp.]|nr:serine protease [Corynebacterium sp.]
MKRNLLGPVLALLCAFGLVFSQSSAYATESQFDETALLAAGLAEEDLQKFQDYLEELDYLNSPEYEPTIGRSRALGNRHAPDGRVGKLRMSSGTDPNYKGAKSTCTASQIAEHLWITARHCVEGAENNIGYIMREHLHFGGVTRVIIPPGDNHDIALVRVDGGLKWQDYFHIADRMPNTSDDLFVVGYGPGRDKPTWAHMRVTKLNSTTVFAHHHRVHTNVIVARGQEQSENDAHGRGNEPNGLCGGDSGASLRSHNSDRSIYGTLMGGPGERCSREGMSFAPVPLHKGFIDSEIYAPTNYSLDEKVRAFKGRQYYYNLERVGEPGPAVPDELKPILQPNPPKKDKKKCFLGICIPWFW